MIKKLFNHKILLFYLATLFLNLCFTPLPFTPLFLKNAPASASSRYITYSYAQVTEDNVFLYKTNLSTFETNAYFEIPKTYFVMLLNNIDDTFYKVQYQNLTGYVLKNKVVPVQETPTTPYPSNITFRVYAQDGLEMKDSPINSSSAQTVFSLPTLPTLTYYGKLNGDELVPDRGSTWYYCKFDSESSPSNSYYGYVYAGFCDNLTQIPVNNENVTPTSNPFNKEDNEYLYSLANLTPQLKAIIVVCVCAPCIAIIFLLFKPFKIKENLSTKNKQIKNTLKNKYSTFKNSNKKFSNNKYLTPKRNQSELNSTNPSLEEDNTI